MCLCLLLPPFNSEVVEDLAFMLLVRQHRSLIRGVSHVLLVKLRLALISWLHQVKITDSGWRLGASILGDLFYMSRHCFKLGLQIFRNFFEDNELEGLLLFHRRLRNCRSQIWRRLWLLLNWWWNIAALACRTARYIYLGLVVKDVLCKTLIWRWVCGLMLLQSHTGVILILRKCAWRLFRLEDLERVLLRKRHNQVHSAKGCVLNVSRLLLRITCMVSIFLFRSVHS